MTNIKITDLAAASDLQSTDVLPIVDISTDITKKATLQQIKDFNSNVFSNILATEKQVNTFDPETMFSEDNIIGEEITVDVDTAGQYKFEFFCYASSSVGNDLGDTEGLAFLQINDDGLTVNNTRLSLTLSCFADSQFKNFTLDVNYPVTPLPDIPGIHILTMQNKYSSDFNLADQYYAIFPTSVVKIEGLLNITSPGKIGWRLFFFGDVGGPAFYTLRPGTGLVLTKL